jgi:hypothetical protein
VSSRNANTLRKLNDFNTGVLSARTGLVDELFRHHGEFEVGAAFWHGRSVGSEGGGCTKTLIVCAVRTVAGVKHFEPCATVP